MDAGAKEGEVTGPGFRWRLQWFALVVGPLYGLYQVTNHWPHAERSTLPLTWLDHALPLLPWTVWPYLLLAGCIFLLLLVKDAAVFRRALAALAAGYSINLLIFAVWPTMLPRDGMPDGLHGAGFAWLYSMDSPANCFPSGHITAPLIAFHALAVERPQHRWWLWAVFALLCPTILTTKQHYAADLAGGVATALFGLLVTRGMAPLRGAPGRPVFNGGVVNLIQFQRNPLRFLESLTRRCGPAVNCRLAWYSMTVINEPAAALAILKLPHTHANKNTRSTGIIKRVAGNSVLTVSGAEWFQRRRLVQPVFHHHRMEAYADMMTALTRQTVEEWLAAPGGEADAGPLMRHLTFRFMCRVLFSLENAAQTTGLERAMDHLLHSTWQSIQSPFDFLWCLPGRRTSFEAARAEVCRFIQAQIEARRREPQETPDLLGLLLAATDADTGERMPETAVVDECITLLIAGYDTTANALTWALILLAQHPEVAARLQVECRTGRTELARAVFSEALRLYPPIWIIERNLDAPVEAGAWPLPRGARVLISPWVMHRSSDYWEDPAAFRPERFTGDKPLPSAYLPFGAGPRSCIGKGLAMMEGEIALSVLAAAGLPKLCGAVPQPDAGVTLRPTVAVMMLA